MDYVTGGRDELGQRMCWTQNDLVLMETSKEIMNGVGWLEIECSNRLRNVAN